jgi:hypothetical protein
MITHYRIALVRRESSSRSIPVIAALLVSGLAVFGAALDEDPDPSKRGRIGLQRCK